MAGIIEMRNVSFAAQDRLIVSDFSHSFEEGKTTALVGPSGSGKSTVLKLSAGLLVPTEGEVFYRDQEIFSMNRAENLSFRRNASFIFQDSALWANQNLYQNLELPLRIHFPDMPAQKRKDRINEICNEVGYRRDLMIRPSQLSMGEQKLIGFARALICQPDLLFLDEWIESLDENAAHRLISLVQRHQKEQKTVIFVSHDFRIVRSLADYVIMITEGKFVLCASREQMENDENVAEFIERGIAS